MLTVCFSRRLEVFARGELNAGNNGFTSSATLAQAWTLDATGNWKGFDQVVANPFTTTRTHNTVNEITGITTVSGSPTWDTPPVYDANGNMTEMPGPLNLANDMNAIYDAWNRLISFDDGGAGLNQVNAYDGMNRRITSGPEASTVRHFYYSDQWQVLEERLGSNTTADRQYVWGLRYIDDLVLRDSTSERLYALQDALFNVVALTDDEGDVVERFAYQPYGESLPLNPDYTTYNGTTYQWTYRFTGRELDLETGLQINRMRYLHLQLGRWLTRDPIGYDGSKWNLYEYVSSQVTVEKDPSGLNDLAEGLACLAACGNPFACAAGWGLASVANDYTTWYFKDTSDGTPANAFKHCLWACLLVADVSISTDCAKWILLNHEISGFKPTVLLGTQHTQMDLHNNTIGVQLGESCWTARCCVSACADALVDGKLSFLKYEGCLIKDL